jgi:hypothetical protein
MRTYSQQHQRYTQVYKRDRQQAKLGEVAGTQGQCHVCGKTGKVFKRHGRMIDLECYKWTLRARRS